MTGYSCVKSDPRSGGSDSGLVGHFGLVGGHVRGRWDRLVRSITMGVRDRLHNHGKVDSGRVNMLI